MKENIDAMHEQKSIVVDDMLHEDLESIMTEMTEDVQKNHADNAFRRLFWQQQLEANQLKDRCQVRWHPAMIRWCLNLKINLFRCLWRLEIIRGSGSSIRTDTKRLYTLGESCFRIH